MKFFKFGLIIGLIGLTIVGYFLYPKFIFAPKQESIRTSQFSLTKAPSQSLKGKILDYSGEIFYQSRIATQAAKLTNFNLVVQQGEDYLTKADASLSLLFPNHLQLNLFENTELKIIQTLPKTTVFSQLNGEIKYQTLGEYPISVRTAFLLTDLKGDVLITRNSENSSVTVKIKSGQARLGYNDLNYKSHTLDLSAGESFIFNYNTRQGERE